MSASSIPYFHNDDGYQTIEIGVKKFMCIGATPPFDHPHVFLTMGSQSTKTCPYCSVVYQFNAQLKENESLPTRCLWSPAHVTKT